MVVEAHGPDGSSPPSSAPLEHAAGHALRRSGGDLYIHWLFDSSSVSTRAIASRLGGGGVLGAVTAQAGTAGDSASWAADALSRLQRGSSLSYYVLSAAEARAVSEFADELLESRRWMRPVGGWPSRWSCWDGTAPTRPSLGPNAARVVFSFPHRDLVTARAEELGLDPYLVAGLIR